MSKKFVGEKALKKFMSIVIGSETFPKEDVTNDEVSNLWDNCEMSIGSENELNLFSFDLDGDSVILNQFIDNTATDVTVYGAYKKDGKTYKTKIGSNEELTENYLFSRKTNIQTITFNPNIDFSECIKFNFAFYFCTSLKNINGLENISTSNMMNMDAAFAHCLSLTSLNLTSFNTSKVTSMANMFFNCKKLSLISNLNKLNTVNVNDMQFMFQFCEALTSLDLTSWDTSNVINMSGIFNSCPNIKEIKVSRDKWNTTNVTNSNYMFDNCGCSAVTYID